MYQNKAAIGFGKGARNRRVEVRKIATPLWFMPYYQPPKLAPVAKSRSSTHAEKYLGPKNLEGSFHILKTLELETLYTECNPPLRVPPTLSATRSKAHMTLFPAGRSNVR